MKSHLWSSFYVDAVLETNPRKQLRRIRQAERAILKRLGKNPYRIDLPELQIIEGARNRLKELKEARGFH